MDDNLMEVATGEEVVPARSCNVEASNPILAEETVAEKLKGDAIGNTLFSESNLLKTLISLSKFDAADWSEQLEEQLCFLWDMTFEEDVIAILLKHDFISLAFQVIQASTEPRLTEIIVGILGNMTAVREVRTRLSQCSYIELLLSLLSSSDALTLLQLVRLLNSCVWHVSKSVRIVHDLDEDERDATLVEIEDWYIQLKKSSSALNENLSFILKSSTNEELLLSTLELLNNLCCITSTRHYFSEFLSTTDILQGLTEALHQLLNLGDSNDAALDVTSIVWEEKEEKASQNWAQTLSSLTLHDTGLNLLYEQRQMVMRSFCCILDPLGLQENIFPLNTRKLDILDSLMDVLERLKNKHNYTPPAMLPRVLSLLQLLSPKQEVHGDDLLGAEDLESEDDLEKHAEVYKTIYDYAITVLCSTESSEFLEAFGDDPMPKVKTLKLNLSKCLGSDVQKIVSVIEKLISS